MAINSAYDDLFGSVSAVEEPTEEIKYEPPQIEVPEINQSNAYDELFGDITEPVSEQPPVSEPPPPEPTSTITFEEPAQVTPSKMEPEVKPPPAVAYGSFGTPVTPPPAVSIPEKVAAGAQRALAAGKQTLAPEVAKTAFLQPTQEKKTAAAKRAAMLPKEAAMHGKAAEMLDPTWYTSEKIQERINRIKGQDPNLANSFLMGDITGAADIMVANAFMSGDENAKNIALETQKQAREAAGELQRKREGREGFTGKAVSVLESVSGMLPMMGKSAAMSTVPVVGPVMSTSMWAKQGAGDIITQLKEKGAPDDVALAYGLAGGLAYSLVEQVQVGRIMNPAVKKAVGNSVRKKVMAIAKEKGLDWFQNVREEVIQGLITENAIIDALKASGQEVDRKEIHERYIKAAKENFTGSAWPMAVLSALGLAAGAGKVAYTEKGKGPLTEIRDEETGEVRPIEGGPPPAPQGPITEMVDEEVVEGEATLEGLGLDLEAFDNLPRDEQERVFGLLAPSERDRVLEAVPATEETRTIEGIREAVQRGEGEQGIPIEEAQQKAKEVIQPQPQKEAEGGLQGETETKVKTEDLVPKSVSLPKEKQAEAPVEPTGQEAVKEEKAPPASEGVKVKFEYAKEEKPVEKPKIDENSEMYKKGVEYGRAPLAEKIPEFKNADDERNFWAAAQKTYTGKGGIRDQENKAGIPSEERVGKEPVKAEPVKGTGGKKAPAGRIFQTQEEVKPILKEKPSEPTGKVGGKAPAGAAVTKEGEVPAAKEKRKEVGREKEPVRQRLETQQERRRTVRAKSRRPASVKRVAEEEKYTPEYWKEQHSHQLNVEAYNALRNGWTDRSGKEHLGGQKGWVDDYNIITDSKAPGGSKNPTLSDNAKQWLQEIVDNIGENPDYVQELNTLGIEQPKHIDDVVAILQRSKSAAEFIQFHNDYEKNIREAEPELDQYDDALRVFNEEPYNLTKDQRDVLEKEWGTTVENAMAVERGEKQSELKPSQWKQQDLFGKEKSVSELEAQEKKRLEKEEVKRRTEETKGGETSLAALPMFEDQDIEGSQQTIKFEEETKPKEKPKFAKSRMTLDSAKEYAVKYGLDYVRYDDKTGDRIFNDRKSETQFRAADQDEIKKTISDIRSGVAPAKTVTAGKGVKFAKGIDYDKLVQAQRETEGMKAAIKDPETGKVYTGWTHQAAIESVPTSDKSGIWGRLSSEWDRSTDNVGFLDKNGKFISRNEAEKNWKILTMEDLKDLQSGKKTSLTRLYHAKAKTEKETATEKLPEKKPSKIEKALTDAVYGSVGKEPVYGSIQTVAREDVSPQMQEVGKVVEDTTGKKVVFIKTDDRSLKPALGFTIDGLSLPGTSDSNLKNTIFVNVDSTRPLMWTAYHEFAHFLETNPEYKKRFWGAVKLTDKGMAALASEGQSELTADIIGEMMSRPDFWENLAKQGRTPFQNIVQEILKIISRIRNNIRKIMTSEEITDDTLPQYAELLTDISEARDELSKIYSEYKKTTGKEIGDIPVRLARGKNLFQRPKIQKVPTRVMKPSKEQLREAAAQEKVREKRAAELEKQINIARKKLKGLSGASLQKRAELALKLDEMRGGQVWEIKNAIYDYAKGIGLGGVPYNKVALMLKNTETASGLKKAVKYLDDVWMKFERRSAYTEVLDRVEKEYRRLQKIKAGKLASTIAPEYNKALQEYLDRLKTSPEWFKGQNYNDMVDKMTNYFNMYAAKDIQKAENTTELPQDIQNWLENPDETPIPPNLQKLIQAMFQNSLSEMTTDQLKQVVEDIDSIRQTGKSVLEQQELERIQKLNERASEIAAIIKSSSTKKAAPQIKQVLERGRKRKKEFEKRLNETTLWSLIDPERMVEWLGGFDEKAYEKIKEEFLYPLYDAEAKKAQGMEKALEGFKERHKEIKWHEAITKPYLKIDLKRRLEGAGLEYNAGEKNRYTSLTLDNMMFIYANSQNPGNLAHLRGTFGSEYMENSPVELADYSKKVQNFTDGIINTAIQKLPAEYKSAVDEQIKHYDEEQWGRVNEVFEKDIKAMMPKEANYFPVQNIQTDKAENAVVADYLAKNSSRMARVRKGMTMSRVLSGAPFREMSYFNTVATNIMQVEHYIAYNQAIKEVSSFLRNKQIKSAIRRRSETVYNELDRWVKAVAIGRTTTSDSWLDKRFDMLRQNFVPFALAIKATTILKQLGSLPKGMAYLDSPIMSMRKSLYHYGKNPILAEAFADSKSSLMKNRTKSYERELAEQNERQMMKMFAGKKITPATFRDIGMAPMGWMDKQVCVVLWNARYHEMIQSGASEQKAVRSADEVIRKTQSRGGVLYMPSLYRSSGILRGFTIFTSDTNQNINIAFELAKKWGMQPTKKNLSYIFYAILGSTLIEFIINQAATPLNTAIKKAVGSDDPEDWRGEEFIKELASQYTRGFPIYGQVADALVGYGAYNIKDARGLIPDKSWNKFLADFAPAGTQSVENLITAISKGDYRGALEAIATARGIPTRTLMRYAKGIKEVQEKGPGEWRKLFWSDYLLREETVYNSMARRLYGVKLGGKNSLDEMKRYRQWYANLHPYERKLFKRYARDWYKKYLAGQNERYFEKIEKEKKNRFKTE